MKKILVILLCVTSILIGGCSEDKDKKVHEDQRMGDSNKTAIINEYNIYVNSIIDSGYNWNCEYVHSYIESLKSSGYKVEQSSVKNQISKVDTKLEEVRNINISKVRKAYDYNLKDLLKNDTGDKELEEKVEFYKKEIGNNITEMEDILDIIKSSISLGNDGSYSANDLLEIKNNQIRIIKIFDNKLRGRY